LSEFEIDAVLPAAVGSSLARTTLQAAARLGREVQSHAEHEQGDADLGELTRQTCIADKTRRERRNGDSGGEIAGPG
jgi:hypothetical protein